MNSIIKNQMRIKQIVCPIDLIKPGDTIIIDGFVYEFYNSIITKVPSEELYKMYSHSHFFMELAEDAQIAMRKFRQKYRIDELLDDIFCISGPWRHMGKVNQHDCQYIMDMVKHPENVDMFRARLLFPDASKGPTKVIIREHDAICKIIIDNTIELPQEIIKDQEYANIEL